MEIIRFKKIPPTAKLDPAHDLVKFCDKHLFSFDKYLFIIKWNKDLRKKINWWELLTAYFLKLQYVGFQFRL